MSSTWKYLPLSSLLFSIGLNTAFAQTDLPVKHIQKFTQAVDVVRNLYVEPVTDEEILDSAIQGMLEALDPHSTYLDKKEYADLGVSTKGEFGGLGIEVTTEHGVVKVVSPIDDTPAHKAGVEAGDLIVKIDGESVKGMTLSEAVSKMRGKKGTEIHLTVVRAGESKPIKMTIERDIIKVKSVKTKVLDKDYGYIRISMFQSVTGPDLLKAINNLEDETKGKLKGIVLDLRNNPGGVLQAAVDVADAFLDVNRLLENKKVVYTKGRLEASKFTGEVTTEDHIHNLPMVVLVNSGTASASEIVAGALQDHGRAVIMGVKTFGKGSVQTVMPLDKETAVKLTTARYYTPKGHEIQGEGVTPDIMVESIHIPYDAEKEKMKQEWRVREADLKNSLAHQSDEDAKKTSEVSTKDVEQNEKVSEGDEDKKLVEEFSGAAKEVEKDEKKPLLYTDYQLDEALTVLKALAIYHK